MKNVTIDNFLHFYHVRQTDSMLPNVCIIDHGGRHNVVITSATHCSTPHGPLFLYLPHFKAICEMYQREAGQHGLLSLTVHHY